MDTQEIIIAFIIGIISVIIIIVVTKGFFNIGKRSIINLTGNNYEEETYIETSIEQVYLKSINKKLTIIIFVILIPYMIMTFLIANIYFKYKEIARQNYNYGITTTLQPYRTQAE